MKGNTIATNFEPKECVIFFLTMKIGTHENKAIHSIPWRINFDPLQNNLYNGGYIYKGKFEGWYCVSDEEFVGDDEVTDGSDTDGKPCKVQLYHRQFHFKSVINKVIAIDRWYTISGNFSRREILAKMPLERCVKFSLSPIFAISRTLNEDVWYDLFFAVSIFGDLREVANSAKI